MNWEKTSRICDTLAFLVLALLIASTCIRAYRPYTFIFRDGSFYAQTNRSIARAFTLRQEEFQPRSWYDGTLPWYRNVDVAWSNVSVGHDGAWYPKHSFLMPLTSTPFYILFGVDGLLLFNALAMFFALFMGYLLASRLTTPVPAIVATLVLCSSPLVPYLAYAYSHDVFYTALIISGLLALFHRHLFLAGLLLGLGFAAKPTNILVIAPLSLALLGVNLKGFLKTAAGAAFPVGGQAIFNFVVYGSPFTTSYHRVLAVVDGQQVVASIVLFDVPLMEGLRRFFTPSAEGELWQMAPLGLLSYAGILALGRRLPRLALALLLSLIAFFVAFAKYRYGGARFFLPWFVLGFIPGSALLDNIGQLLRSAWTRLKPFFLRRAFVVAVAALFAMAVVVAWLFQRQEPSHSLLGSLERLKVYSDNIICDYFNMTHQKWECSGIDRNGRQMTGLALPGDCPDLGRRMLYVAAHSNKVRKIEWQIEVKGERLLVLWSWANDNPPKWRLEAGGVEVAPKSIKSGDLGIMEVRGPLEPGTFVKIIVEEGQICIDAEVLGVR